MIVLAQPASDLSSQSAAWFSLLLHAAAPQMRLQLGLKTFIIQGFVRFSREFIMPIYAYRCEACGFAKDALQKMSDPVLTECPECGKSTFKKQVTAAGFQLKGTGWYVTDFRSGQGGKAAPVATNSASGDESVAKSDAASTTSAAPVAASTSATASNSTSAATSAPSSNNKSDS